MTIRSFQVAMQNNIPVIEYNEAMAIELEDLDDHRLDAMNRLHAQKLKVYDNALGGFGVFTSVSVDGVFTSTSATRSTQPSFTRALNPTLRSSASDGTSRTPDTWPPSSWTAPRLSSSTSASPHSLLSNSSGTRPTSMPSSGNPITLATSALLAMTPRLSFRTSPPMGQPIEVGLDPILAYTAGAEIEQL
ncbi:hypothetical protein RJ640_027172 [Escallonia rubra]|uniref:Uncharacterized protein n=1 Tax=Escallonia rubra TaxID=112253 RepID=A0AA88UMS1_9ASTE|nr:hypothetical protein RJ640_027172 [Escallonia rubra]